MLRARKFSKRNRNFSNSKFPEKTDLVNSSVSDITNSITIPAKYLEARANDSDDGMLSIFISLNLFNTIIGYVSVAFTIFSSLQEFLPPVN